MRLRRESSGEVKAKHLLENMLWLRNGSEEIPLIVPNSYVKGISSAPGAYILKENFDKSFEFFTRLIPDDGKGLCLTRICPDKIKGRTDKNITFYWLSRIGREDSLNPESLKRIMKTIKHFLDENERCVVFIQGLEYLRVYNDFSILTDALEKVIQHIIDANSLLILPVDPSSIEDDELTWLEGRLKPLEY